MNTDIYKVLNRFEYCETAMVTVIIHGKAACVMLEEDFNRIIKAEQRYKHKNRTRVE